MSMRPKRSEGFTLVELMIVVAITTFLAAIAIPKFASLITKAKAASLTKEFVTYTQGFKIYMMANEGDYPPDTHNTLPAGMEIYLDKTRFEEDRPLGGNWNWEGPDGYTYAALSIFKPDSDATSLEIMTLVDKKLDDGNLSTGDLYYGTVGSSMRFHYIFDRP